MSATSLPWYSFLYRLCGAQGTFWLWIVACAALWWTGEPATIALVNRRPQECDIDRLNEQAGDYVRWVRLRGVVELTLDRSMFPQHRTPRLPPVVLLLDPDDPAAQRWVDAHRLAAAALEPGEQGVAALHSLSRLMARHQEPSAWLPAPERAILVQDERMRALGNLPPLSAPQAGGDIGDEWARDRDRFAELARERVRVDVTTEGLLLDTPGVVAARLKDELDGLRVAPYLIQPGRQPRQVESAVFAVAAITLVFLASGLWGAARVVVQNGG